MAEIKRYDNRLGLWGWLGGGRWGVERYAYILHRLTVAGNRDALSFGDGAFDAIHEISDGIPRKINTLGNFLLLTAFTEERRDVSVEMVRDVAGGLGLATNAESDGHAERPATAQSASGTGDIVKKRALLRALGVMFQDSGSAALGASSAGDTNEYPASVRSIGLRLQSMEKELAHIEMDDYEVLKQRVDALEAKINAAQTAQKSDHQAATKPLPAQAYCDLPVSKSVKETTGPRPPEA